MTTILLRALAIVLLGACWVLAGAANAAAAAASAPAPAPVTLLALDGGIGPANADYVVRGIARAARDGSQLVVVRIDTPGGLDLSMRSIVRAILASPVPVATYVAPGGARAASAGTYILYASHIAAMAPGTNLGAATPVRVGGMEPPDAPDQVPAGPPDKAPDKTPDKAAGKAPGKPAEQAPAQSADKAGAAPTMTGKQVNDAAAYIRSLAQMRGRNADWAERAVREAVSLPAQDALALRVVDYLAADLPALLAQLDGASVVAQGQARQLHTRNAVVAEIVPDWRASLLAVIADPGMALILLTVGIYGLIFEFASPGAVAPGVVGAICLLLALYALQLLPVNYAGLALVLLGLAFMVAEAFLPSFGVLGLGGIVAFVGGALILIDTELPGYGVPPALIAGVAVVSAVLAVALFGLALRTRRRATVGGPGDLIGATAQVVEHTADASWALLRGETWRVVSAAPLRRGQRVRVLARQGLVLRVAPADENDKRGE